MSEIHKAEDDKVKLDSSLFKEVIPSLVNFEYNARFSGLANQLASFLLCSLLLFIEVIMSPVTYLLILLMTNELIVQCLYNGLVKEESICTYEIIATCFHVLWIIAKLYITGVSLQLQNQVAEDICTIQSSFSTADGSEVFSLMDDLLRNKQRIHVTGMQPTGDKQTIVGGLAIDKQPNTERVALLQRGDQLYLTGSHFEPSLFSSDDAYDIESVIDDASHRDGWIGSGQLWLCQSSESQPDVKAERDLHNPHASAGMDEKQVVVKEHSMKPFQGPFPILPLPITSSSPNILQPPHVHETGCEENAQLVVRVEPGVQEEASSGQHGQLVAIHDSYETAEDVPSFPTRGGHGERNSSEVVSIQTILSNSMTDSGLTGFGTVVEVEYGTDPPPSPVVPENADSDEGRLRLILQQLCGLLLLIMFRFHRLVLKGLWNSDVLECQLIQSTMDHIEIEAHCICRRWNTSQSKLQCIQALLPHSNHSIRDEISFRQLQESINRHTYQSLLGLRLQLDWVSSVMSVLLAQPRLDDDAQWPPPLTPAYIQEVPAPQAGPGNVASFQAQVESMGTLIP